MEGTVVTGTSPVTQDDRLHSSKGKTKDVPLKVVHH